MTYDGGARYMYVKFLLFCCADLCAFFNCGTHGQCVADNGVASCVCNTGYVGTYCDLGKFSGREA